MSAHKHEFHGMWWHFGQYGSQDVHMHPCECGVELQGPGRSCDGEPATHKRIRYSERTERWVDVRRHAHSPDQGAIKK